MKALILAGGRGKRLDERSIETNKCMIPIKGQPVIEYSLNCAANTEIDEIILVVGYRAEEIINTYGTRYKNKKIKYVIQWERRGLVHAIECAREAIAGDDFLLLLGDEVLVNPRHQTMIDEFKGNDQFIICGVLTVEDKEMIKRTYTLIQDDNQIIYRLVEKPRHPFNHLMGTGDCVFRNGIFDYIEVTPIHHERKEKELPDLIQCAIDDGKTIKSFLICDRYSNINSEDDIERAESILSTK
jgi:NDP-sugar pyrophosphorylase family protein